MTNSYNAIGQLTGVTGLAGIPYVSAATYNAQGQLTQLVNENGNGANGLTRQWTYETNTLRLSTIQAGTNASFDNLQKLTYSYDNGGNVTNLVDMVNAGQRQCYQYDWLDRLTGAFTGDATCAAYSATGTGPYNHTYAYDSIGNITSNAGNTYTYGDASHKHAVTAAFGNSYGYDANGNQTTRTIGGVTYTFTYDYENHLTAVSGGSVTASFVYDADGNRVKGTVNGTTTVYIAGLYEYQGGATTLYYEGNTLRRTGYATDNGVFYLLQDQLKSSSVLANQNGTVNSRNYFYPFGGNRSGAAFSALTTKRFTGQYHETGLPGGEGLSYYGARWYDAQLGRFTGPDTIVPNSGDPQAVNRYSYVKNNPLGHYDITPGNDPYWKNTDGASQGTGATIAYGDFGRVITSMLAENTWQQMLQSWNPAYLFPLKWPVITGLRASKLTSNDMTAWLANRIATDSQSDFVKGLQMETNQHLHFSQSKIIIIVCLLISLLTGCSSFVPRPVMGAVWLGDPIITSGLDQQGEPVDNVKIFDKDVTIVYCYLTIKGTADFKMFIRWYHENQLVMEQPVDFGTQRKAAALLNYHNGEPLPPGEYRCEFGLAPEKPLRSVRFHVNKY